MPFNSESDYETTEQSQSLPSREAEYLIKPSNRFTPINTLDDSQPFAAKARPLPPLALNWFSRRLPGARWTWVRTGWRMGIPICLSTVLFVLIVNISVTVWATRTISIHGGIGILLQAQCSRTKSWGTWLHLGINALSTLLLSASNYTMQCLVAPTRTEINRAHGKGDWLDIGVPSVRNLSRISRKRVRLWLLLGLSSVPLHLIFNSVVFEVLSANEYGVAVVTPDFLTGATFDEDRLNVDSALGSGSSYTLANPAYGTRPRDYPFKELQRNATRLQRLSNKDCIIAYSNAILSDRRNLLAITLQNDYDNGSLVTFTKSYPADSQNEQFDPLGWICGSLPKYANPEKYPAPHCNVEDAIAQAENWSIIAHPIEYCLSEIVEEQCEIQFSLVIMIMIIICNLLKGLAMILTMWKLDDTSLVTVGDAASSFLFHEDRTTSHLCMVSRKDIPTTRPWSTLPRKAIQWHPQSVCWLSAVSYRRWIVCLGLCSGTLAVASWLLNCGIKGLQFLQLSTTWSSVWSMGFGSVNANALVKLGGDLSPDNNLVAFVLLANLPQLILSALYILYNAIYSSMVLTDEWIRYGIKRKSLRVSAPRGQQRSTYYLQLPYRYGVPLLVASAVMHWLLSQSIFLARVRVFSYWGVEDSTLSITTAGYSCAAIICAIILGFVMVLCCVVSGLRRFPTGGAPLASSCSIALSAACHRPADDDEAAFLPVKWGDLPGEGEGGVGHCSLSSKEVLVPEEGRLYA